MTTTIVTGVRRLPESDSERMAGMERQIADLKAQLLAVTAERDDLRCEITALHATEDNLRRRVVTAEDLRTAAKRAVQDNPRFDNETLFDFLDAMFPSTIYPDIKGSDIEAAVKAAL